MYPDKKLGLMQYYIYSILLSLIPLEYIPIHILQVSADIKKSYKYFIV